MNSYPWQIRFNGKFTIMLIDGCVTERAFTAANSVIIGEQS